MLMGKMWRGAGEMVRKKRLPIGIEDFEEIRTEDFYYVDKTGIIFTSRALPTLTTVFLLL